MSQVVQVVPEIDVVFDGRADSTQSIPLRTRIPTTDWRSGVLSVRLHAKSTWASSAVTAAIIVRNVVYTPDDPSTAFSGSDIATVTLSNGSTVGSVTTDAMDDAPIGPMVSVYLVLTQGATATAQQTLSISVDLVGRMY